MTKSEILKGLKNKDRLILAKAMTLFESTKKNDQILAQEILSDIERTDYPSRVIGITGTPGVGKSTFLNSFGKILVKENKTIAILTVDPSSEKTKGSILGDKTRMSDLIQYEDVFIRPSSSGALLGGTTATTKDLITLCEAFGFDYIFVESVGVGQSEVQLAKMVDFLLLFLAPGGGDDLQGIKKGILEYTDLLVINKADDNSKLALQTAALYGSSLSHEPYIISALKNTGLDKLMAGIENLYVENDISEIRLKNIQNHFWEKLYIRIKNELDLIRALNQDGIEINKNSQERILKRVFKNLI